MACNDDLLVFEFEIDLLCILSCPQIVTSEQTFRDYTHHVKAKPGFQPEIDEQICRDAKLDSIPEFQKYMCLVFNEVKVKENLVYNKHY